MKELETNDISILCDNPDYGEVSSQYRVQRSYLIRFPADTSFGEVQTKVGALAHQGLETGFFLRSESRDEDELSELVEIEYSDEEAVVTVDDVQEIKNTQEFLEFFSKTEDNELAASDSIFFIDDSSFGTIHPVYKLIKVYTIIFNPATKLSDLEGRLRILKESGHALQTGLDTMRGAVVSASIKKVLITKQDFLDEFNRP